MLVLVERTGNFAVVLALAVGLVVAPVTVGMLGGSETVVEGTSARRRVHVDVGSEVADAPPLQDSRTRTVQSERKSVADVPSWLLPMVAVAEQRSTAMVLDVGVVEAEEVQAALDGSLAAL